MTTVSGLFAAGDASGASSHKFSSGSFTEGRIAAKGAISFVVDHSAAPQVDEAQVERLKAEILRPLEVFEANHAATTDPDINPAYIRPKQFMHRMQKIMDEYAGGVSSQFKTSGKLLEKGMELLAFLKADAALLAAENGNELMRCWENMHRLHQAEAHVHSLYFREETRWPGYCFRTDKPSIDNQDWLAFCNCVFNRETGEWKMIKRPVKYLVGRAILPAAGF
jgi:adenylylsulfate reductase, subunit A